jgi:hypothetical protein
MNQPSLRAAAAAALALLAPAAHAVNWIMLQGTEPAGADALRAFGFASIEYQHTDGTRLPAGPWQGQDLVLNQIGPELEDASRPQVPYFRIGWRGRLADGKVNYWLSPLWGVNGVNEFNATSVTITDASVTLNLIPHARLRIGQFKQPGMEEGLMPTFARPYVNLSSTANMLVLERLADTDGDAAYDPDPNTPYSVNGFRDIGVQVFDAFRTGPWEHTYAAMLGNGNGLLRGDNNDAKDLYLYWSSERVFSGKGPMRQGLKLLAWYQVGERRVRTGGSPARRDVDRTRYGVGAMLQRGPLCLGAEYVKADGMIFNGTDAVAVPGTPSNDGTRVASYNLLADNEADGGYLEAGYRLLPKLEVHARYERVNRGTDSDLTERRFQTATLGATYWFAKKTRLVLDYEHRDFEAPGLPGDAIPNRILDEVDDRVAVRLYHLFF